MKKHLIAEGLSDKEFLISFLENRKINYLKKEEIKESGNYDKVKKNLSTITNAAEEGDKIGIIIDADENIGTKIDEINICLGDLFLTKRGFLLENELSEKGFSCTLERKVNGGDFMVGVFIMPDNKIPGSLETFILNLIDCEKESKRLQHAKEFIDSAIENNLVLFSETKNSKHKAKLHAWLALQKQPGASLKSAVKNNYINTNSSYSKNLVSWLKKMYKD